jgi:predicted Zn-ribbon and HTH transcriptional regulator
LLKWGLKSNNIETIEVSSTERKVKKAVAAVKNAAEVLVREKRSIMKNRASCRWCPFENTQYCTSYG